MTTDRYKIPRVLARAIGDVLTDSSLVMTHEDIDAVFKDAGAPGEPPDHRKREKVAQWLTRCNEDQAADPLRILGGVLKSFMDLPPVPVSGRYGYGVQDERLRKAEWEKDTSHVRAALASSGLEYLGGGALARIGGSVPRKTFKEMLQEGDLLSVEIEFERAHAQIETDPPAALTAACSLLEALFKVYIESDDSLELPKKQTVKPLWTVVSADLGFRPDFVEDTDLKAVLSSLTGLVDGLGALRTHASSAHGRGLTRYAVQPRHARLAVNASHTIAAFVIETWKARRAAT